MIGSILMKHYREKFMAILIKYMKKEEISFKEMRTYEKILSMFHLRIILKYFLINLVKRWVKAMMIELEKIRQLEEMKSPKKSNSIIKNLFGWNKNSDQKENTKESPKKTNIREELHKILTAINNEKILEDSPQEKLSEIKCGFVISDGKIHLFQELDKNIETLEFRYKILSVNYFHNDSQDFIKFNVKEIESFSTEGKTGEITRFLNVSSPEIGDYLKCEASFSKKDNDFYISANLQTVFFSIFDKKRNQ